MRFMLEQLFIFFKALRVIKILKWSIVAGIAFSIANTFLFFLAPPFPQDPSYADFPTNSNSTPTGPTLVISKNLFGITDDSAPSITNDISLASETRLPLELLGIFASDDTSRSSAIIAETGKPGVIYFEGDMIPGNVRITKVDHEYVLLKRQNVLERLTFPKPKNQDFVEITNDITLENMQNNALGENRKDQTPSSLNTKTVFAIDGKNKMLDQLGISAVSMGKSKGYRVGGLVKSQYLSQTGLQPGDLILSVNGQPVGDIEKDKMEIDNIMAQGSARLEIQRGTRTFFVTATL